MFNTPTMITKEEMDSYVDNIEYYVITGRLPPSDMKIVERYKEYKKTNREFKEVDFKKLMNYLLMEDDIMKTNIIKTEINLGNLRELIFEYQVKNERKPYLFMSEETLKVIGKQYQCKAFPEFTSLCMFEGHKVFLNTDLLFGEVEIR